MSDDNDIVRIMRALDRRIGQTEVKEVPIYETGTFTPVYKGSGTAGSWTYSTQIGRYIRFNNLVIITIDLIAATRPVAPTGNALIDGLPFTAFSTGGGQNHASLAIGQCDATLTGTQIEALVVPGTTQIAFLEIPAGGGANTNLAATGLTATCAMRLWGGYEI